ncbi:MAG: HEAT repeat domain-containing protein [Planctomycetes bacterium]|nr:HEAT repeat domain-containing protein [Planctomycetota bacterium]
MRTYSLVWLAALSACSSGPSPADREKELYDRIAYLRASFDTAYADHNTAALDAIVQEMRRHAFRYADVFVRDLKEAPAGRKRLAAFALAFSERDRRVQEALLGVLRNEREDGAVVETVLIALGMIRMEDTPATVFTSRFSHPSPTVRQAALYGFRYQIEKILERHDARLDDATLQAIFERLTDSEMDVRNEAVIVLRQVRIPEIIEPVVQHPLRDVHPLVRQNAAITLAALGAAGQEAVPHLIEALRDGDTKVVEAVWTALTRIAGKDIDRTYATWRDWYDEEEKRMEYACAAHPQVVENAPGKCPECKAKLARRPKPEEYRCPVHPDVRMGRAGRCTTCRRAMESRPPEYACADHPVRRLASPQACPTCSKVCTLVREMFTCLEHPDVEAPYFGRCSRCERDLVRRIDYLCPTHPDMQGRRTDACRKCGKPLQLWLPGYVCRDHANSKSDRPGKCDQCQKERSPVREKYTCATHPEADAPVPGKCSRCEADLVPKK